MGRMGPDGARPGPSPRARLGARLGAFGRVPDVVAGLPDVVAALLRAAGGRPIRSGAPVPGGGALDASALDLLVEVGVCTREAGGAYRVAVAARDPLAARA